MPKVVELLGPSGIGKTSLYVALQNLWTKDSTWAVYHDFRYKRRQGGFTLADISNTIANRFRKYHHIQYVLNEGKLEYSERKFANNHPEFTNRVLDLINIHNRQSFSGSDKRFTSYHYFFRTMEQIQAVMSKNKDPRICIMYEAFLCRIMHLISPGFDEESLDKYLEFLPSPDAVIYLEATSDLIMKRIKNRKRIATVHDQMNEDEIHRFTGKSIFMMNKAVDKLENSGVKIYRIDGSRPADTLAKNCLHFIEQLQK